MHAQRACPIPQRRRRLFIASILVCWACASGGAAGGDASRAAFQRNLGTASAPDAMERVARVLRLFQFDILREDATPDLITIETHWRKRVPFDDERVLGITGAENRVIVTGRIRTTSNFGAVYNLAMSIDNRVTLGESPEWVETSATDMYRAFADSLTINLQRELQIGVRRYGRF
jgi:hypothetical protein